MADHASLTLGDKSYDLPVIKGTTGPDVVDVRKFYAETDNFTFDPGFTSTASCESKITYIDGDAGILLHRGYPIEQLAENSNFLEVCYLLLNGELPDAVELSRFRAHDHLPHDDPRPVRPLLRRLPVGRPPDGDHDRRGRRPFGLLSRQHQRR